MTSHNEITIAKMFL